MGSCAVRQMGCTSFRGTKWATKTTTLGWEINGHGKPTNAAQMQLMKRRQPGDNGDQGEAWDNKGISSELRVYCSIAMATKPGEGIVNRDPLQRPTGESAQVKAKAQAAAVGNSGGSPRALLLYLP
mmetsp:Transcript_73717/g.148534  ORF Transcript_73717/g.148534 Transcript_73717/m.148534 type:complete len:126 (+) Transcript_73717:196-573(+)